jgi:hypothetical protein
MVDGPLTVIIEALWVTVALTALVLGCAVDGSWWSLLTATCYVLALGVWSLFRPGCMPCVAAAGTLDMSAGAGCCGGQLWAAWGAWLTSFLATSTFGVAFTLFHNNAVRAFPGSCTLVTRVPTLPPSPPAPPAQGSPRVSLCCRGADCLVCLCACVLVCLCACGRRKGSVSRRAWSQERWSWLSWCGRCSNQQAQRPNPDNVRDGPVQRMIAVFGDRSCILHDLPRLSSLRRAWLTIFTTTHATHRHLH